MDGGERARKENNTGERKKKERERVVGCPISILPDENLEGFKEDRRRNMESKTTTKKDPPPSRLRSSSSPSVQDNTVENVMVNADDG